MADRGRLLSVDYSPAARDAGWTDLLREMQRYYSMPSGNQPGSAAKPYMQLMSAQVSPDNEGEINNEADYWRWRRAVSGGAPLDQVIGTGGPMDELQTGIWTGGRPKSLSYPRSPYTNPFARQPSGWASNPYDNPPISDAPIGTPYKSDWADPSATSRLWDLLEQLGQTRQR